jgi:hypothetical protein
MAGIERDGPFSRFVGIDRTLCVLEGAGMRLAVNGRAPIELTPDSAPYSFPGDVAAAAVLLGGPVRDLNVMTRRARLAHRLIVVERTVEIAIDPSAVAVLVYCHAGGAVVDVADGARTLAPGETLCAIAAGAGLRRLQPAPNARCHLIELSPARPAALSEPGDTAPHDTNYRGRSE